MLSVASVLCWMSSVHACLLSLSRVRFFGTPWSPSGSSVHGVSQARILEWVAISSSRCGKKKSLCEMNSLGISEPHG